MKDNRREAKAPQKRSLSALRCLFEEHGKRPQSALCGLLGAITEQSEDHQSPLRGILGVQK